MHGSIETCRGSERCVNKVHVFLSSLNGQGPGKTGESADLSSSAHHHVVLFFVGDDLGSTSLGSHPDVQRMSDPAYIAEMMSRIFPEVSCVAIIAPSRYEGGFACYDHFLEYEQWDITGMHIKGRGSCQRGPWVYTSKTYKALKHIYSMLLNSTSLNRIVRDCVSWKLVGFSKGGIVINQILTEISHLHEQPETCIQSHHSTVPHALVEFSSKLSEVHYLDVGLPCPGAFIWDDTAMKGLSRAFSSAGQHSFHIVVHGTSRQFGIHNHHLRQLVEEMISMLHLSVVHALQMHVHLYNIVDDQVIRLLKEREIDKDHTRLSFHHYDRRGHDQGDEEKQQATTPRVRMVLEHCRILEYMTIDR